MMVKHGDEKHCNNRLDRVIKIFVHNANSKILDKRVK